jgi:hypothetical protein
MKLFNLMLLTVLTLSVISCEKEEAAPQYTIDDFVGSWKATSLVQTNNSNTSEMIDVISIGGELRFTMLEGGNTRTWFTLGNYNDEWDAHVVITDDKTITSTPAEIERGVDVMEFSLENGTLTLTNANDEFDFSLAGETPVSSTSSAVFVRN